MKKISIIVVFGLVLFLTLGTVQAVVDVDVGDGDVAITSTDADPNSGMIRDSEEEEQETEGEREAKTGEVPTADPESNTDMKETDEPVLYMGTDADTDDDMAREEAAGGDNN